MSDRNAPPRLRRLRLILWATVAFAVLGFGSLLYLSRPTSGSIAAPGMPGFTLGGAPFALTDADGHRFASSALAGKPYLIFFGFTHCPDVCPTTLARLSRLRAKLPGSSAALRIVFVTVDPERDTAPVLKTYASLFDTPVTMLTGSAAEIAAVEKQHGIYAAKVPQPGSPDGYTMDHSAAALLFDRSGKFVATIAPDEPDAAALAKLKRVVG